MTAIKAERSRDLKPCPFCGGEAVDRREVDGFPMIYCNGDDCFGPQTTAKSFEDALVQWNTRTTPAGDGGQRVSPGSVEAVAWQFRQRRGVGKGPQNQAPWCDWCAIRREDYDNYIRHPNPLVQVRPLYVGAAQAPADQFMEDYRRDTIAGLIERCATIAEAIDSGRGNEKEIAKAIRALKPQDGSAR